MCIHEIHTVHVCTNPTDPEKVAVLFMPKVGPGANENAS